MSGGFGAARLLRLGVRQDWLRPPSGPRRATGSFAPSPGTIIPIARPSDRSAALRSGQDRQRRRAPPVRPRLRLCCRSRLPGGWRAQPLSSGLLRRPSCLPQLRPLAAKTCPGTAVEPQQREPRWDRSPPGWPVSAACRSGPRWLLARRHRKCRHHHPGPTRKPDEIDPAQLLAITRRTPDLTLAKAGSKSGGGDRRRRSASDQSGVDSWFGRSRRGAELGQYRSLAGPLEAAAMNGRVNPVALTTKPAATPKTQRPRELSPRSRPRLHTAAPVGSSRTSVPCSAAATGASSVQAASDRPTCAHDRSRNGGSGWCSFVQPILVSASRRPRTLTEMIKERDHGRRMAEVGHRPPLKVLHVRIRGHQPADNRLDPLRAGRIVCDHGLDPRR